MSVLAQQTPLSCTTSIDACCPGRPLPTQLMHGVLSCRSTSHFHLDSLSTTGSALMWQPRVCMPSSNAWLQPTCHLWMP